MVEITIYEAQQKAPHIFSLLQGRKIMAFGDEKCILGGQKGKGGLGFYASFKPDENWSTKSGIDFYDKKQIMEWFKKEYREWSSQWYEIFENAELPLIPRPIYCMPLKQSWDALPNLTLLGDAAHVMPPFAGEGANTAMLDAVELSERLLSDEYDNIQQAIAAYEKSMHQRTAKAAKQSLENGERMHAKGALEKMLVAFGIKKQPIKKKT